MTALIVSGVGSVIGYGLLRSMRAARPRITLIGIDTSASAVGREWCDHFEVSPAVESDDYAGWLRSAIVRYDATLLIPGFEQDVHFLSDNRDSFSDLKCALALNSRRLIDVAKDKWLLHLELLKLGGEATIPTYCEGDYEYLSGLLGNHFLLKPRNGYASKGIVEVRSSDDFEPHRERLGSPLIAQKIVGSQEEEYTVSVFGDGRGSFSSSIALRRTLGPDGATSKAWSVEENTLQTKLSKLCDYFLPIGPTNFQFRRHEDDWLLLEINPRVSSSTSIRSALGYNEAEMAWNYFVEGRLPNQPSLKSAFVARYLEDIVYEHGDHI